MWYSTMEHGPGEYPLNQHSNPSLIFKGPSSRAERKKIFLKMQEQMFTIACMAKKRNVISNSFYKMNLKNKRDLETNTSEVRIYVHIWRRLYWRLLTTQAKQTKATHHHIKLLERRENLFHILISSFTIYAQKGS